MNQDNDIYLIEDGILTLLSGGTEVFGTQFLAMSPDAQRIFFRTQSALLPEDADTESDIYEWSDGQVALVSTGPNGAGNGPQSGLYGGVYGTSLVYATDAPLDPDDTDDRLDLYAWDGTLSHLITTTDGGEAVNQYNVAPDGGFVVWNTGQSLVPADTDNAADVYRFSITNPGPPTLVSGSPVFGTGDVYFGSYTSPISADGSTITLSGTAVTDDDAGLPPDPRSARRSEPSSPPARSSSSRRATTWRTAMPPRPLRR